MAEHAAHRSTQDEEVELPICPDCCSDANPFDSFCRECGRPLQALASFDPWKRIFLDGYVYRRAAYGSIPFGSLVLLWIIIIPSNLMFVYLWGMSTPAEMDPGRMSYADPSFPIHTADDVAAAWAVAAPVEIDLDPQIDRTVIWIRVDDGPDALPVYLEPVVDVRDDMPEHDHETRHVLVVERAELGVPILSLLLLWRITSNYMSRKRSRADDLVDG